MSKIKICIDAGHGGKDHGAVNNERFEKDDNLKLAMRLGKVLEANGIDIYYTRETDIYDGPKAKTKKANDGGGHYFISIHRNASISSFVHGVETYVYKKEDGLSMAEEINKNLEKIGFTNRGVKANSRLTVLNQTDMPAILIELGYISSDSDNALYDKKFNGIVNAVAGGIITALGMEFKTIYRIGKEKAAVRKAAVKIEETVIKPKRAVSKAKQAKSKTEEKVVKSKAVPVKAKGSVTKAVSVTKKEGLEKPKKCAAAQVGTTKSPAKPKKAAAKTKKTTSN